MRYLTLTLSLFLTLLSAGCAQPTEYDFCLQYQEAACACGEVYCSDQLCEQLDLAVYCDPEAATWSAKGCEVAHLRIAEKPWACLAEAMATCDEQARVACYPPEER